MSATDAVCFDLDGTLCVSEQSDAAFTRAVFERVGVDPLFTPRELRAVGPAEVERERERHPAPDDGTDGITEFYTNLYRAVLRDVDADVDPGDPLVTTLGRIAGDLHDPTAVRFRDGAERVLERATESYAVGLITNGSREVQTAKLETLGIADAFDATVFCDPDRGIETKPARGPFERALRDLSTPPSRAVHVGDSHAEDVVGAHEAGLDSIWVPTRRPHESHPEDPDPAPTHRVDSLAEVCSLV